MCIPHRNGGSRPLTFGCCSWSLSVETQFPLPLSLSPTCALTFINAGPELRLVIHMYPTLLASSDLHRCGITPTAFAQSQLDFSSPNTYSYGERAEGYLSYGSR